MTSTLLRLGLSGTCYWCTEAIFLSLKRVTHVEQGWISSFDETLMTQAYLFNQFKLSAEKMQNYYYTDSDRPFCKNIITPKLNKLLESHGEFMNKDKLPFTAK